MSIKDSREYLETECLAIFCLSHHRPSEQKKLKKNKKYNCVINKFLKRVGGRLWCF